MKGSKRSCHHGHNSSAKVQHSCLNITRFEDSVNKMLLIASSKERTNPAVPRSRAGWGVTLQLRSHLSQQCHLPGEQGGVLKKETSGRRV